MTCCHESFTRREIKQNIVEKKEKRKRSDLICELYTNAYKLGANWDGQDFKNHAN